MDVLRADKEVGGYAEIGEKGTFEPGQDGYCLNCGSLKGQG